MSTVLGGTRPQQSTREEVLTRRNREHAFYTAMALTALALVAIGFSGTAHREFTGTARLSVLVQIHAAIAAAWLLLFLVQVRLVAASNIRLHRQLGSLGVLIAIAHVSTGFRTSTVAAAHGFDLGGGNGPVAFMIFPLGDLLAFTVLVTAALLSRRRQAAHKRLMLLALTTTLGAPLQHFVADRPSFLPFMVPVLVALWFASAAFDRIALGRMHPVSLWGGLALFIWGNSRAFILQHTDAWQSFGSRLIS